MPNPSREERVAEFKERLAAAKEHRLAERFELARAEYLQALSYAEEHFGEVSAQVDEACLQLALFHGAVGEYESELADLERRVRIRKAEAGIPQIVDALQDLAEGQKLRHRPEEAEATYQEAVRLCEEGIEAHRLALSTTLLYFGSMLCSQERLEEAVKLFERGLKVCRQGSEIPTFTAARLAMNLGETLLRLERPDEGLPLLAASIPVVTHRSNPGSLRTARILLSLGNHHQNEGRHADAARAYDLALLQVRAVSPVRYSDLGHILQAYAENELKAGRPAGAEDRLRQAIRCIKREKEAHDPALLSVQQDLVNLRIQAKRYADAEPVLEEMTAATEHPDFDDLNAKERYLNNLGFVQVHLEKFPKAEASLRRALTFAGKAEGCYAVKNLGLMYQKMGYAADAEREYRRALALFEQHHSAEHPVAAFIRGALAELATQDSEFPSA